MDLTQSYDRIVPPAVRDRYSWVETRNAAAVMASTNPGGFDDLLTVLGSFKVEVQRDLIDRGGRETKAAAILNEGFRSLGWREGSYNVTYASKLTLQPFRSAGEIAPLVSETEVEAASYKIDNLKDRLALDVEWHAKDGNLDRDVAAYRSLYDAGIIDAGAIVTVRIGEMHSWVQAVNPGSTKFGTTTSTNLEKLEPRLRRGDAGGCPVLAVGIGKRTV